MIIPQLVGHRGYPRHYPENTLVGIEAAVAAGARFVEVDVQNLPRPGAGAVSRSWPEAPLRRGRRIQDFRYDELWAFRVSEPGKFGDRFNDVHITRLAELGHFLQRHRDVTAFIELKRSSLEHFGVETMLNLVRRALKPALKQCVLISYALEALLTARRNGWRQIGVVIDHWKERHQELIAAIQPQFLFCDVTDLPQEGELRLPGMKLVIFEVAEPRVALDLAARGVDFIETFAVGEMLQELAHPTDTR